MLVSALLVVAALGVLTLGAELLVRGSMVLARRLRVSSFFIGLTIVGFGTSTPELFTSLIATARDQVDISVGNVIGSNTFNVAVILGLTALVTPIAVRLDVVRGQAWTVVAVSLAPFLALLAGGRLGRCVGAALLGFLLFYVWRGFRAGQREEAADAAAATELEREVTGGVSGWRDKMALALGLVGVGLLALVGGSSLLIDASSRLAREFGISELAIGLTIVAAGTSAPELFTSFVAAMHRQSDIVVGNILGSNVFNIAGILGLVALLRPPVLHPQALWLDLPVMVAASVVLVPILATGSRISRGEGAGLVIAYAVYLWALLAWAPERFAA